MVRENNYYSDSHGRTTAAERSERDVLMYEILLNFLSIIYYRSMIYNSTTDIYQNTARLNWIQPPFISLISLSYWNRREIRRCSCSDLSIGLGKFYILRTDLGLTGPLIIWGTPSSNLSSHGARMRKRNHDDVSK